MRCIFQHAGKTTFVNLIASGQFNEVMQALCPLYIWRGVSKHESLLISRKSILYRQDMIPTVGFNMRKITKGRVTIKLWDIGGQPRWEVPFESRFRVISIHFQVSLDVGEILQRRPCHRLHGWQRWPNENWGVIYIVQALFILKHF